MHHISQVSKWYGLLLELKFFTATILYIGEHRLSVISNYLWLTYFWLSLTNLIMIICDNLKIPIKVNLDFLWPLEIINLGYFCLLRLLQWGQKNLNPSQKFLMVYLDSMIPIKSNYVIIHLFPLMIKPLSPFSTSGKSKFLAISAPSGYINGDKKKPTPLPKVPPSCPGLYDAH